jgi:hypothetical protein
MPEEINVSRVDQQARRLAEDKYRIPAVDSIGEKRKATSDA